VNPIEKLHYLKNEHREHQSLQVPLNPEHHQHLPTQYNNSKPNQVEADRVKKQLAKEEAKAIELAMKRKAERSRLKSEQKAGVTTQRRQSLHNHNTR
jgi:hypothetical protein